MYLCEDCPINNVKIRWFVFCTEKDPGMVGREDRGTVTMLAPHTTTEDPWGSVLGLDVVMALILALLGIGISIAVGVLAWYVTCFQKFHKLCSYFAL